MDNQNNNSKPEDKNTSHNMGAKRTHDNSTLMGVLSYLGPLVIIPYLSSKDNQFVKFHVKQGLVLFCLHIILWVLTPMFFWQMWSLLRLINLTLFVLTIIGIVNVVHKKESMLPVIGTLAKYFKF
jgi:uncharacterized membrane protein